ncbi:MAG TPA: CtsR family transcriptional regulator [Tissierellaceae bacterium]|nr:CtsR family transcriptional regulator [Tissierellaceae bacterium]
MPGLSNIIERFIMELFQDANDNKIEIQRNEMAQYFDCSPSQINYVLSTRFTPYRGYYIESKRGGGGYIKIIKVEFEDNEDAAELMTNAIGDSISKNKAYHIVERLFEEELISKREEEIIKVSLSDSTLSKLADRRNEIRADMLKNILLILLKE